MRNLMVFITGVCAAAFVAPAFAEEKQEPPALADELEVEQEFGQAAVSRRRQAMLEPDPIRAAGWYFLAANNYSIDGRFGLSGKMLDLAEDAAPDEIAIPAKLLRAENAYATGGFGEASFFFQSMEDSPGIDPELARYARRGRAATMLLSNDPTGAAGLFAEDSDEWLAIQNYRQGSDKSPRIGGILGIVPGLGYAYSGEYGNAVRSLILNSLFIWGMYETGARDQWAAFSVITFFELTWYTGSIYGGVDAAHRRNRERLSETVESIRGPVMPTPDRTILPLIRLKFEF